ncbi:MAG: hypothetical protein L0387_22160 [Acidobacteria bacterium]|nr:hypothetical protein [Acidobacteriota bacterium]MCI0723277.1 hypothetical protein [Acidobacteriota bacterium]
MSKRQMKGTTRALFCQNRRHIHSFNLSVSIWKSNAPPNGGPVPSSHDPNPVIRKFEMLRQMLAGHVAGGTVLSRDRAMRPFGNGLGMAG